MKNVVVFYSGKVISSMLYLIKMIASKENGGFQSLGTDYIIMVNVGVCENKD